MCTKRALQLLDYLSAFSFCQSTMKGLRQCLKLSQQKKAADFAIAVEIKPALFGGSSIEMEELRQVTLFNGQSASLSKIIRQIST